MKKKVLIISGIVLVLAVAILILKPFGKKAAVATFETVKVTNGSISNTVTATGTIAAITSISVGTQVSGILQHLYVKFNDRVKKGQLLAQLDTVSLKAQLDQSQSQVDQAKAQLNFEEATYKRLKVLYDKQLLAQSDYDQALYNFENSRASLNNALSALSRAQVNLNYATITSPIDGVVLNKAVEEGQTVAASFNTPTLFTIVNDLTQMQVQTSVDEADIGKVKQDQRVEFTVDAYPDMKFEGKVSEVRIQPVTTNNVVTYTVILSAPNPEEKLMPGMTASATIYIEEKANTLLMSGKALRFTPGADYLKKMMDDMAKAGGGPRNMAIGAGGPNAAGPMPAQGSMPAGGPPAGMMPGMEGAGKGMKTVWMKDSNGMIHPMPVTIGVDNGSNVEVLTGLKEGDEVVISMTEPASSAKKSVKKSNNGPGGPFGM